MKFSCILFPLLLQAVDTNLTYESNQPVESQEVNEYGDDNCGQWKMGKCVKCSHGFILNNEVCTELDLSCKSYNSNGSCSECYKGYQVKGTTCVESKVVIGYTDVNCAEWKLDKCVRCSGGFAFQNGVCIEQDSHCKNYNSSRLCSECYQGYQLKDNKCVESKEEIIDLNCSDWKNSKCLRCSYRYYLLNSICVEVDRNCKGFNSANGNCNECYKGYDLKSGKCVQSVSNVGLTDPYCAEFKNNKCVKCSYGFFFFDGVCYQIDPNCKGFNEALGKCVLCYQGYEVKNNKCVVSTNVGGYNDPNCAKWKNSDVCQQCVPQYAYLNGKCVIVKTIPKPTPKPADQNINRFTPIQTTKAQTQTIQNANSNSMPTNSYPVPIASNVLYCVKYTNNVCSQCFPGYLLEKGRCNKNF